jgi:hypothetical protein
MRLLRFSAFFLIATAVTTLPPPSKAQTDIDACAAVAPPPLPDYEQPPIPAPGYIWTPGYWGWGEEGYYWVPGTWAEPPAVGLLWTPGYWALSGGTYLWHAGYWGPHIGFYGGINYGFGYVGVGYAGGYWDHGVFTYNRTVNNFGSTTIVNVYSKTVINNSAVTNVSFNGGKGGTTAVPTPQEQAALHEQRISATPVQTQHQHSASTNRELLASINHGKPAIAATAKPGEFSGHGVVAPKDVKPTLGPITNAKPDAGVGQRPLDVHKPVPGRENTGRPTGLTTSKPTTHGVTNLPTEPNVAHPATVTPHTLDARRGPGAGDLMRGPHPAGAARLPTQPAGPATPSHPSPNGIMRPAGSPHPPGPNPNMRAAAPPRPATPHPAAQGGSPPKKNKPDGT